MADRVTDIKKAKKANKKNAHPKQARLPTMAQPEIPELDAAAERYVSIRDQRMALTKDEVGAAAVLLELMHKHKLTVYELDDESRVLIDAKEKVKVQKVKDDRDEAV
jgi:hypothetical protein